MAGTLGVLVAGGEGSRLGLGIPKALVRLGETTLLERGWRTLMAVCDDVVVAAPAHLTLPLPAGPGVTGERTPTRVFDPPGIPGPLAGVVAGLQALPYHRALVLAVDLPFATADFLAALLGRLSDHAAVVPEPGRIPQPLAAAYSQGARVALAARLGAGERSMIRALESLDDVLRLDDATLAMQPGGLAALFNVNTYADLMEAERRLSAREAAR